MNALDSAIENTKATLCAHSGAVLMSRAELATLKTPERTSSWTPVPHSVLADCIEETLRNRGLDIRAEQYAVQGEKIFGTLRLQQGTGTEASFALGFRASNDKTLAVQMIAGANVFVCDNMAFSGEVVTLNRKHTGRLNLAGEIGAGVDKAVVKFNMLSGNIDRMKAIDLTGKDVVAKAKILDAAVKGIMPLRLIPDVCKHYFEPLHAEFEPRNVWSLHNAFTEAFKELRPNVAMQSAVELGQFFNI